MKLRVVDLEPSVVLLASDERYEAVSPEDLARQVGRPHLDRRPSRFTGRLEHDDNFEVGDEKIVWREVPERTSLVDAVYDLDRPGEEVESGRVIIVVVMAMVGFGRRSEALLFKVDRAVLAVEPFVDEDRVYVHSDQLGDAHVADAEHQAERVVSVAADDRLLRKHDRLRSTIRSSEFGEDDSRDDALHDCTEDRLKDEHAHGRRTTVCYVPVRIYHG